MSTEEISRVTATTLTAHRFLHGLPCGQIAQLVPAARLVSLSAGRRIFADGGSAANRPTGSPIEPLLPESAVFMP